MAKKQAKAKNKIFDQPKPRYKMPVGNQFWKMRSKHGREKLFATPDLLWEAALEYFQWCEDHPLIEMQAKVVSNGGQFGSSVEMVEMPKLRAMTLSQLCLYLGCDESYFRYFKSVLNAKESEEITDLDREFLTVINRIEKEIYNQKLQGAAAGLLNANIIARDLGLVDRQDIKSDDKPLASVTIFQLPDNGRGQDKG